MAYIAPPDTVSEQPWAAILSLDWVGDAPLTAGELPRLRPFYKDFIYWPRDLHRLRVPVEILPQYTLVGTLHRVMDQYAPFDSAMELKALPCLSDLICGRGIRFSVEDMLSTVKSEKEEHGALDNRNP